MWKYFAVVLQKYKCMATVEDTVGQPVKVFCEELSIKRVYIWHSAISVRPILPECDTMEPHYLIPRAGPSHYLIYTDPLPLHFNDTSSRQR